MLDARLRPWIDPPLTAMAMRCAALGATAKAVTWVGCALGLAAAALVAAGWPGVALPLFLAGRVADGLDGAIARTTAPTDRGGFLDIVCDFLVYAAVPLAFAIADPAANALAAAALLASFIASGVTFLAFAAMMLWPSLFTALALGFAALCAVSAAARIVAALHALR
jgi:phosphatidylglycerophosphate synthase